MLTRLSDCCEMGIAAVLLLQNHHLVVGGKTEQVIGRLQLHHRPFGSFSDQSVDRFRRAVLEDQFIQACPLEFGAEVSAAG